MMTIIVMQNKTTVVFKFVAHVFCENVFELDVADGKRLVRVFDTIPVNVYGVS